LVWIFGTAIPTSIYVLILPQITNWRSGD